MMKIGRLYAFAALAVSSLLVINSLLAINRTETVPQLHLWLPAEIIVNEGGLTLWAATLNQDGSWSIKGNLAQAVQNESYRWNPYTRCIADELLRAPPRVVESADNSHWISTAEMNAVIEADPIMRQCRAFLGPHESRET